MGFTRPTNHAGGLEGGMTNGEPLVVRAAMKPIPTLMRPLPSVDFDTLEPIDASKERSDVCAVPAAGVVGEAEVAMVLAQVYMEKFGSDCLGDIVAAHAMRTWPGFRDEPRVPHRLHGRRQVHGRRAAREADSNCPSSTLTNASSPSRAGRSPRSSRAEGEPRFRALEREALEALSEAPTAWSRAAAAS